MSASAAAHGLPTPARGRDAAPTRVSTRPWIEHWLETCRDLSELKASHPMMDAVIDEIDGRMIRVGDQWLADFASCNYLGFDLDREIIDAIPAYLDAWGTHPSWSRLLGSPVLYEEIEERLTALLGSEDSLVLPTITHIHMSVIPLLAASGTIFLDARAHKTIYDGCQVARARGAAVRRFRFEDPDHLDELLRAERDPTRLVCMDGVNSMTGNPPDLPAFAAVARKHGALLYVDDAHGFGVIGERGPDETSPYGSAATASSATSTRPTTTSSSSAASPRPTPRCWRSSPARPTSRTCSRSPRRPTSTRARRRSPRWRPSSPASTSTRSAATSCARVLSGSRAACSTACARLGVYTPNRSGLPIIEIPLRDHDRIDAVGRFLFDRGVYVTLAAYPLVPKDEVGFRVQLTAANTDAEVDMLLAALEELAAPRRAPAAADERAIGWRRQPAMSVAPDSRRGAWLAFLGRRRVRALLYLVGAAARRAAAR